MVLTLTCQTLKSKGHYKLPMSVLLIDQFLRSLMFIIIPLQAPIEYCNRYQAGHLPFFTTKKYYLLRHTYIKYNIILYILLKKTYKLFRNAILTPISLTPLVGVFPQFHIFKPYTDTGTSNTKNTLQTRKSSQSNHQVKFNDNVIIQ